MARDVIVFDSSASSTTLIHAPTAYETTMTHRGMASILLAIYQGYCEALFEALAEHSPDELVEIVREGRAPNSRLTYAAEILGRHVASPRAVEALRNLLDHPSPLVREGAVLGLEPHLDRHDVKEALHRAVGRDPSPGVRRALAEALES